MSEDFDSFGVTLECKRNKMCPVVFAVSSKHSGAWDIQII